MRFGPYLKVVSEAALVIGFFVVGFYMVLSIYGYRYDSIQNNFEKTSIIDLGGNLKNVEVFLDNKIVSNKLPFTIRGVDPGVHHILVKKPSYFDFKATLNVNKDLVSRISSVVLMPEKITFEDAIINSSFLFEDSVDSSKSIYFDGSEIWITDANGGKNIVSRTYSPISIIKLFSDNYNLLFVRDSKLFFCDQLMQNCYALRNYEEGDSFVSKSGKIFYKEKSGKIFVFDLMGNSSIYAF